MKAKVIFFTMAYNAHNTVRRTIDSILNQTYTNFDYFILDNGSTDDTNKIILEYAKRDHRIKHIHVNKNDPTNGGAFFTTIMHCTNADYMVWCDADDEYTNDFLEKMVGFAEDNQLDIAACGYDMIDGNTGKILKHRALDNNLIISGDAFANDFITYRGFMPSLWGKLYSVSLLRRKNTVSQDDTIHSIPLGNKKVEERMWDESFYILELFKKANRAGVYGKSMYLYYQYPSSLSRQNIIHNLPSYNDYWTILKQYLEYYGPISKINLDFLYAIYLSLVEEFVEKVFVADLSVKQKIDCLSYIFSNSRWAETLARKADPQFRNLAAKRNYVDDVKKRILALVDGDENKVANLLNQVTRPQISY